jgi:hypothetical protein
MAGLSTWTVTEGSKPGANRRKTDAVIRQAAEARARRNWHPMSIDRCPWLVLAGCHLIGQRGEGSARCKGRSLRRPPSQKARSLPDLAFQPTSDPGGAQSTPECLSSPSGASFR